ncbi:interleukin-1 receptor type 2-like isoform X2 [Pseudochaenichthys georgianus]|uniref:interleukin-1 receptor type 2-like isoform X2 n=1 Tax=Pseudochaenichthys georgianus TaxID=52239 RepID=UPI00146B4C28|nr:uncharacterized protein LOC117448696 isoform X2 [Pseudochaenichthys georgianus]
MMGDSGEVSIGWRCDALPSDWFHVIKKNVQLSRTAGGYSLSRAGFMTRLLSVCCAALQGITMEKVLVLPLFLLLSALTGVCPRSPTEIYVEAGEMVALNCRLNGEDNHRDAELIWTSPSSQEMDQTPNMSSAEQRNRDLLVHGRSLVILNATANHQGNYSCSLGNSSSQLWFRVTVTTKQRNESTYPQICYTREVCRLICPNVNAPAATSNNDIWHKEGESSPKASYFSSVEEKDHGVYTCTRSYLYYGQIYNMTFTVVLDIQPKGSPKVIDCEVLMDSEFDEVFWFSTDSFVETNSSFPVFYNYTKEINGEEIKMTASLVFKKVSDEDLLKNYTCKLQTVAGPLTSVTISLSQKHSPSHVPLALGIVGFVVMILAVVVYVRFKMISMRKNQTILRS